MSTGRSGSRWRQYAKFGPEGFLLAGVSCTDKRDLNIPKKKGKASVFGDPYKFDGEKKIVPGGERYAKLSHLSLDQKCRQLYLGGTVH